MESPFRVTLLRVELPAAVPRCGLVADELPRLTGWATLVPVPEVVRLDDETEELPVVLVPEELEPPLTWEPEDEPLPTCVEPEGRL